MSNNGSMLNTLGKSKEVYEVVRLRDEHNLTFQEIADKLGFSKSTAQRRYTAGLLEQALGDVYEHLPEEQPIIIDQIPNRLPEDRGPLERFKPITVTGDCMVTADWHIPLHDPVMINHLLDKAEELGITQLIIAGDFFHADTFGSYLPYQPEASWDTERYDANLIAKVLLQTFDSITVCYGNHDYRISRSTGYKHSFTECFRWALSSLTDEEHARIQLTDLDFINYEPGGQYTFRVCHPSKHYSAIPLAVPKKLAASYRESIISGHSHHLALGFTTDGKRMLIEPGGFFHPDRTQYIQETSANHNWIQGFVSFKDGVPTLYSPSIGNL